MKKYYVNNGTDHNGDHEVHVEGCSKMPSWTYDLGYHSSCTTAVAQAKITYPNSNGCFYCSNECHTS